MWTELFGIALSSFERPPPGPGLARRLALVGLFCSLLAVSLVLLVVAFGFWLAAMVGRAPALAITGASGLLIAALGLLIVGRRPAGRAGVEAGQSPEAGPGLFGHLSIESITQKHPLEAVTIAAAAGVFVASSDGAALCRPLLDALLRSLGSGPSKEPNAGLLKSGEM